MATTTFRPNKTSLAIMQLVHGYFSSTRKPWTLMSQDWILGRLQEWYGYKISRSTLNYNLRILRDQGMIETVTRHMRCPKTRQFIPKVTLYRATKGLRKFFYKLAAYFKRCRWTPELKTLKSGYVPSVGVATNKETVFKAYLEETRRRKHGSGT